MITKRQKKNIIKELGHRYCMPISEALNNKGIRNRYGLPHSNSMITNVMNGQEHKEIEAVIFSLLEEKKQEKIQQKKERDRILSA